MTTRQRGGGITVAAAFIVGGLLLFCYVVAGMVQDVL